MTFFFKLIIFINLVVLSGASATTLDSYQHNRQGVQKFKEKMHYPAYQAFLKALESDPLNPDLHLNLGLVFEQNEEWEKAVAAYRGAINLLPPDSTRRFEALFNLAGVYAKQRRIPEALEVYQQALDVDPDSREVKTNIELLWQGDGGGGESKSDQKKEDKGDKQDPNQQQQPNDQPKPDDKEPPKEEKKQPRPFKSEELTPEDVKKIIDELKNQEQSIRAEEYERKGKESPRGKDW